MYQARIISFFHRRRHSRNASHFNAGLFFLVLTLFLASLLVSIGSVTPAHAAGWYLDETMPGPDGQPGAWYYYLTDTATGNLSDRKTGWFTDPIDGYTYYLDPKDGRMLSGRETIDGTHHLFEPTRNRGNYFPLGLGFFYYKANGLRPYGALLPKVPHANAACRVSSFLSKGSNTATQDRTTSQHQKSSQKKVSKQEKDPSQDTGFLPKTPEPDKATGSEINKEIASRKSTPSGIDKTIPSGKATPSGIDKTIPPEKSTPSMIDPAPDSKLYDKEPDFIIEEPCILSHTDGTDPTEPCIARDRWEQILENPGRYETCIQENCTKALLLDLTPVIDETVIYVSLVGLKEAGNSSVGNSKGKTENKAGKSKACWAMAWSNDALTLPLDFTMAELSSIDDVKADFKMSAEDPAKQESYDISAPKANGKSYIETDLARYLKNARLYYQGAGHRLHELPVHPERRFTTAGYPTENLYENLLSYYEWYLGINRKVPDSIQNPSAAFWIPSEYEANGEYLHSLNLAPVGADGLEAEAFFNKGLDPYDYMVALKESWHGEPYWLRSTPASMDSLSISNGTPVELTEETASTSFLLSDGSAASLTEPHPIRLIFTTK